MAFKDRIGSKEVFAYSVSSLALAAAVPVHAQVATDETSVETAAQLDTQDDTESDDGVIVVTAQRREQSLLEVPVSITAISSQDIQNYQIDSVEDYAAIAPNVGFIDSGNALNRQISLRGVSNFGGTVAPVAIYVDEFNITGADFGAAFDIDLLDIERIEVLRGPQGTLFGRNVSGGLISITTVKPDQDFSVNVEGEYASFDEYLLKGGINVPLGDVAAARVTAFYRASDGFIDNLGPSDDTNDRETFGIRGALRLTPNDRATIDVAVTYVDYEQGLDDQIPTGILSAFLAANGFPVDPFGAYDEVGFFPENDNFVLTNDPNSAERETLMVTAKAEYEFDTVAAIINFGFLDLDSNQISDADFTPSSFFTFPEESSVGDTWSIEPRLQSIGGENFDWVFGGIYARDDITGVAQTLLQEDLLVGLFGLPPGTPEFLTEDSSTRTQVETLSVFGDVTWHASESLDLSFGLRYSNDEVTESFIENPVFDVFQGILLPGSFAEGTATFDTISGRFSALYRASDDINLYATISRGVRPGGFNVEAVSTPDLPDSYGSETTWNYEAGVKGTAFQGDLIFSLSGYVIDWTDLQDDSVFFPPGTVDGFVITTAAGGATSYGIEAEFSATPIDGLRINGGFGLQEAEFDEFDTIDLAGNPVDASGNALPLASDFTGNIALQYNHALNDELEAFGRVEGAYRSSFFESSLNDVELGDRVDGYETVNVRLGLEGENWRASVFGENLTNNRVLTGSVSGTAGLAGVLATIRPRRFGVRLSYTFE
ncbi:MAG: TonB-dependent receptor [Pseudomonadota bacterium]